MSSVWPKRLRGLRDVARRLVADLLGALEAEELAVGVGGFDDAVGEKDQAVAVLELESGLLVVRCRR